MKLLFILSIGLTTIGGTNNVLSIVSKKLEEENNEVKFLILNSQNEINKGYAEWVEPFRSNRENVHLRYFEPEPKGFELFRHGINVAMGMSIPKLYLIIRDFLRREFDPDIIIINQQLYIRSIKEAAKSLNLNSKIIAWHQNSLLLNWNSDFGSFVLSKIINSIRPKQVTYADAHLAISTGLRDQILRIDRLAKVYTVFNPVIPYTGPLIPRSKSPVFIFVGRLDDKQKNISFMLEGFSKIRRDWKLIMVGKGSDEDKLKGLSKSLGISRNVEWRGFVNGDPYSVLSDGATALILTSRFEGFGMVLAEANQRGIPAISSDCQVGPSDIIIHGKNGYLFPEGDMNAFVQMLNDVIDGKLDFDTPEYIAKTAERFSEGKVCKDILQALDEIYSS